MRFGALISALILTVLIAACSGDDDRPTRTPSPVPSPSSTPLPAPFAAARDALARKLNTPPVSIEVIYSAQRTWPDTCLGLATGTGCTQVQTPGHHLVLRHARTWYSYRTDLASTVFPDPFLPNPSVPPVLKATLISLAERLGPGGGFTTSAGFTSLEEVAWPDACLGLPRPGEVCAAVVTRGYRLSIAPSATPPLTPYEYRADLAGKFRF